MLAHGWVWYEQQHPALVVYGLLQVLMIALSVSCMFSFPNIVPVMP